jgi:hypothetical protein
MSRPTNEGSAFLKALALRNQIEALGWPRDLLAVEVDGQHVGMGAEPAGYRVVLAWPWPSRRLERVTSLEGAQRFLPFATSPPGASFGPAPARSTRLRGTRQRGRGLPGPQTPVFGVAG